MAEFVYINLIQLVKIMSIFRLISPKRIASFNILLPLYLSSIVLLCPVQVTCEWEGLIGHPSALVEVSADQLIASPSIDAGGEAELVGRGQEVGLLQGVYAKVGSIQNVSGLLIVMPSIDRKDNDDELYTDGGPEDTDWVGVLLYPDHLGVEETTGTASTSVCLLMLERMKKAMLLGASAIILLAMNKNVLREIDVSQLISRPIVVIEDLENITYLLSALSSNIRQRVKIAFSSPPSPVLQTYTVWSSCWRAHPGSGVICMSDTGLSKVNPSLFWSYFYSVLAGIMLLLLIKTERHRTFEDVDEQESVGRMVRQALSVMKTRRYQKSTNICNHDDSERDTCAICLDQFYCRQKIRVLPCVHEFHRKCVDAWLIRHPTCPLCKLNVIG